MLLFAAEEQLGKRDWAKLEYLNKQEYLCAASSDPMPSPVKDAGILWALTPWGWHKMFFIS